MTGTVSTRKTEPERLWCLSSQMAHRLAIAFWLFSLVLFRQPLISLASFSVHEENSSHILLIPPISAGLIFLQRKRIFPARRYSFVLGISFLAIIALLWWGLKASRSSCLSSTDSLSVIAALIVLVWIGGFIFFYGLNSFQAAAFPLAFLLLTVPMPAVLAEKIISVLQQGSAETCYILFRSLGVPVIRHGFLFSLPGVDIEVAQQCSGIHSALSLFITGLLIGHLLLQSTWKKVCFILCILPIAIFKNAIRIVTIAWLGIHVTPDFFYGALHRQGGLPFSLLALMLMAALLWLLHPSSRVTQS